MSELLKALKELRITAKQSAGSDYNNQANILLTAPRRRMNINVTRIIQDPSDERYSPQS